MREDGLHHRYDSRPWLEKQARRSVRVKLEHRCKESHPSDRIKNIRRSRPLSTDAMSCVWTTANTKTKTSKGTGSWFNSRNRDVRNGDGMLTKGEGEGTLKDHEGFVRHGKT